MVAAVRVDVDEGMSHLDQLAARFGSRLREDDQAAFELGGALGSETDAIAQRQLQAGLERWRSRKAKVTEAQENFYRDVVVWSSLPPERSFNEVILPALRSGHLVAPSEPCFEPVIVAAYRVCEAAARQKGVNLEAHMPPEILQMVSAAGDLYK